MAKDAIEAVKTAEEKAKQLINDAISASKISVSEAEEKAKLEYDKILSEADNQANTIKERFIKEAEDTAKPILDKGNDEVEKIKNTKDDALEDSVNIIIERIVNANGNS